MVVDAVAAITRKRGAAFHISANVHPHSFHWEVNSIREVMM